MPRYDQVIYAICHEELVRNSALSDADFDEFGLENKNIENLVVAEGILL